MDHAAGWALSSRISGGTRQAYVSSNLQNAGSGRGSFATALSHPWVDAIIVFSDILIVAEAMGLPLDVPDSGPVLSNPVRDAAAIAQLRDFDPSRETKFVGDAIRAICKEAGPDVPVIASPLPPGRLPAT